MRWQVEDAVTRCFDARLDGKLRAAGVTDAGIDGHLARLDLQDGSAIEVGADTLVVDAMGAGSPLMRMISGLPGAPAVEDRPSSIGYATQLFRLRPGRAAILLPDPVADCSVHLGPAYVTLYAGAGGWFSVTLAWDIRSRATTAALGDTAGVVGMATRSAALARWIAAAEPVGPSRRYLNPRNRWSLPVIAAGCCPPNYVAIGDALTTTAPTLGAGCSWPTTHIRILADALAAGEGWRDRFVAGVAAEQRAFFDLSVATGAPQPTDPPPTLGDPKGPLRILLSPILDRRHHAAVRTNVLQGSTPA